MYLRNPVLDRERLRWLLFLWFVVSQVVLMGKSPLAKAGGIKDAGVIPGLGRSPEKGMTTYSIVLAWRIP